ncbi:MAG: SDR family NAD(P)-dependent oxidoreductase [Pseudomonadota bacterium]|nr:SDR family NAD(P)-dependent oxidoreductase [Pseudomonadota bacterium]
MAFIKQLKGQRVIITGASSGIGEALAIECARRGMHLGLVARREDCLQRLAERLRPSGVQIEIATLDVTQTDQVLPILSGLADLLGGVDLVIANAGILKNRKVGDGRIYRDQQVFQTNVMGAIATSEAAIQLFRLQGHGGQIAVTSSYSAFLPLPTAAAYSASKAAVTSYFNAIRAPLLREKIRVTVMHPSFVKTDMLDGFETRGLPIVARADEMATDMMDAIAREQHNPILPKQPWGLLYQAQKLMPNRLILELQKRI